MKLTTGAVECLSRGAAHDNPDANAVGQNGDLFEAGQMVTEGDAELRRSLDIDEYHPVLEAGNGTKQAAWLRTGKMTFS